MTSPVGSILLDGGVLAGRHLVLMSRRPASIVSALVLPLVFTVLFFAVFERLMRRAGVDYAQYLLPAVIVQAAFFTGMSAAVLAAEDSAGGMLRRLRGMPIARSAPALGLLGAELFRTVASLAVLVALGALLGFRFHGGALATLGFLGLAVATALTCCAGFIAIGLALVRVEAVQALGNLIYFPLLLLSNAFTPAAAFPGWLEPVVANQPVSRVADAMRALADGAAPAARPVLIAVAWLGVLFLVCTALGARAFGRST